MEHAQFEKLYQNKLTTAEEAVKLIEPGDGIIYPLGAGEPAAMHKALSEYEGLDGNRLYTMLTMNPVIDLPKEKLEQISFFLSGSDRGAFNEGLTELVPNSFSEIPNIIIEREKEPVLIATVSPMDEDGYFSLGVGVSYFGPQIERAKKIIIEVNETMPYTYGIQNHIHISQVDALIENNEQIPVSADPELNEKDEKIGAYIADMINDGDTIQVGIGSMPNAVMNNLVNKKGLGLHSEMFTPKAQLLHEKGVLTNQNKQNFRGTSIATFAVGPKEFYDFMNYNEEILMIPCNMSNGLKYIAENNNFVSINSGVEVDLLGQVNAEKVQKKYYSSTGGQADFAKAVNLSKGGRGVMALYSTAAKGKVSTIVPTLFAGAPVTTTKNDIDMVVTEYGVAKLKNKTIRERVEALIAVAHPDFRDELRKAAIEMGYISE
ncbi:acetyl-CoA hydrolase/transferase family protein [Facklamia sp. DSM 111018]|uniref:Acetyl-CoA hydrolase/transferase family protein n=1 Tax=Facklamia lactis TaxID=2749967 RepID=A0ABS0LQG6_9LACT|nr:acetyl-CoA hydrolase/transferase family protein [Facklamia lactis]MBG9980526.1 acetyl-CoA hydrolase/transferase family protein [Facklamia lactis]MBG9986318.1 acetyl-CoA hydrolase/transferase family protein [Facklamia lactis]